MEKNILYNKYKHKTKMKKATEMCSPLGVCRDRKTNLMFLLYSEDI